MKKEKKVSDKTLELRKVNELLKAQLIKKFTKSNKIK